LRLAILLVLSISVPAAHAQDPPDFRDKLLDTLGPAAPTPLTREQGFQAYLLNTIGPIPIIGEGLGSALAQRTDSPSEWGQGWAAYGKRFGSNLAYNAVRQTISYSVASALHEDYRYFGSPDQGVWRRARHALVSTVAARRSDGREVFSFASVASVAGASSLSSIWGPPSWKGAANISEIAGISFASTAAFNVIREFLPDILGRPRK